MESDKIKVRIRNSVHSLIDQAGHLNQLRVEKKIILDPILELLNLKLQSWDQRSCISQMLPSDLSDLGNKISDSTHLNCYLCPHKMIKEDIQGF